MELIATGVIYHWSDSQLDYLSLGLPQITTAIGSLMQLARCILLTACACIIGLPILGLKSSFQLLTIVLLLACNSIQSALRITALSAPLRCCFQRHFCISTLALLLRTHHFVVLCCDDFHFNEDDSKNFTSHLFQHCDSDSTDNYILLIASFIALLAQPCNNSTKHSSVQLRISTSCLLHWRGSIFPFGDRWLLRNLIGA